ncbi:MAG: hypothetical protein ACLP0L_25245, partial [Solirubrobacteraceae bacterium]
MGGSRRQTREHEQGTGEGDDRADRQRHLHAAHERGARGVRQDGAGGAPDAAGDGEGTAERAD